MLKRQIAITDTLVLGPGIDLLLETLQLVVERKKWHCKVLIRSILIINKFDNDNGKEEGYFEKIKSLVKSLLDSGACSNCEPSDKSQIKQGLLIYFLQTAKLNQECK